MNGDRVMNTYKVSLTIKEDYELIVQADSLELAHQIARDTDIDKWNPLGYITLSDEIEEIK